MEVVRDPAPDRLRDVLAELGERVAPVTRARERILPVQAALRPLFPDGGLVRGRVHASVGSGAATMATAMVRDALLGGRWMAVVDVDGFGADAANEAGIPLERVVRVATRPDAAPWLEVMAAVVDGFDVVVAAVPDELVDGRAPAAMRSLLARIQQRGAVVVILGRPGVVPIDVTVTSRGSWSGLGDGHGVLRGRRLSAEASGRRQPVPIRCEVDLRVDRRSSRLEPVVSRADPTSVVMAEMIAAAPVDEAMPAPVEHRAVG